MCPCKQVQAQLMGSAQQRAEVERRFPLITHLWPNVEQFRCLGVHQ